LPRWSKPQELAGYPGQGFENALTSSGQLNLSAEEVVRGWLNSPHHRAVILEESIWKGKVELADA
jgi:uncharacterized protein YkwD